MRITIKDIARELDIHHSTVSRALRNDPRINTQTKRKIQDYAEHHGYRQNIQAVHFRGNGGNVIAMLTPNINHRFFSNMINHITNFAYEKNFVISVFQSNESFEQEQSIIDKIIQQDVTGVIASISNKTTNGDHYQDLINLNIPLVFFDRIPDNVHACSVINNNKEIVYELVEKLVKNGKKRIVHLTGPMTTSVFKERSQGYYQAIKASKIKYEKQVVFPDDFTMEAGQKVVDELFNGREKPPDAIISNSSFLTIGVIHQLNNLKISIPEEVTVAGFGDHFYNEMLHPHIISVEQPEEEMAKTAFELLLNQLSSRCDQQPVHPKIIKLKSKIIFKHKKINI
jgi:LacI family transcriptional regulator